MAGWLRSAGRLMVVLPLFAVLADCNESGYGGADQGSAASTSPQAGGAAAPPVVTPPAPPAPLGATVGCPNPPTFSVPVAAPASLTGLLEACRSVTGDALLIKNPSAVMLAVTPGGTATYLDPPVRAGDDLRSLVGAQLAADAAAPGSVRVPPGGYVVARARGVAQVDVGVPLDAASQAYAADVLMRYLESKTTTRPQRLTASAASCAEDTADVWEKTSHDPQLGLDGLMAQTALGPAYTCKKFFSEVSDEIKEPPPQDERALAAEFGALRKDVRASVWDDLVNLGRRVVPVVR